MQRFEPIEGLSPRRAQGVGEPLRRKIAMVRAGLPLPMGHILSRGAADALYARVLAEHERLAALLDPQQALPDEAELAALQQRVADAPMDPLLTSELARVDLELRGEGASALALTAYIVCERADRERVLGNVRLDIAGLKTLKKAVSEAFAQLFEPAVLRSLRAAEVRDASVALFVQRMVDGIVSGLVYTRHPLTGDPREWLIRAGYGLASAVREGRVPSDVMRVTRDGFVRDVVVVKKDVLEAALPSGAREVRKVPEALVEEPCITRGVLSDVQRLAERVERHMGQPVHMEWSIAEGQAYLLRVDPLPGPPRIAKVKRTGSRERELWSHVEVGEALPHVLTPLAWSLLHRFARGGLDSAMFTSGVSIDASSELLTDVRGSAYLNLGLLTEAVCRMPGITPEALSRVGLPAQSDLEDLERAGPIEIARAALRVYDAHVRFGRRLGALSRNVAGERVHFAGIDARLLSPDAVERVLRDVEGWLFEVGIALMRAYGIWLGTLVGLRALLVRYAGTDALRLERDLLWGPDELRGVATADDFAALARTLTRDSRALNWAESAGAAPTFVREAVNDFAMRHHHEGVWLLDPASPRWRETPERLEGALRGLLADPMGLAMAIERRELVRGRRERAEREWKRLVPVTVWPLVALLLRRLRELTQHRESLTTDTAQAIGVIRDIARDASRRLEMRYRGIGADAAFFLELEELHQGLSRGQWDVAERVSSRRIEQRIARELEPAAGRFVGLPGYPSGVPDRLRGHPSPGHQSGGPDGSRGHPSPEHQSGVPDRLRGHPSPESLNGHAHALVGVAGSGGAAEGRVVRVQDGSELAQLGRASVLVVPACDVGLCAILPAVRAVISEQGGMLSHGAMLASALGVPVVVGVENASRLFRDGERVRVDADTCKIERLGS